jgi:hypothetical protein
MAAKPNSPKSETITLGHTVRSRQIMRDGYHISHRVVNRTIFFVARSFSNRTFWDLERVISLDFVVLLIRTADEK